MTLITDATDRGLIRITVCKIVYYNRIISRSFGGGVLEEFVMVAPNKKNKKNELEEKIKQAMEKILPDYPDGIRPTELAKRISKSCPDIYNPIHTIRSKISTITNMCPEKFQKDETKPLYSLKENSTLNKKISKYKQPKSRRKEEDFYKPFAKFLKYSKNNDEKTMNECTKAIELGGNRFRGPWQTPDVIGLFEPVSNAVVRFTPEIISAEIKNDITPQVLMTAFGQACSYRLFSHKTYLVVPQKAPDLLEPICYVLGMGLVLFDPDAKKLDTSIFKVKLRAQKHEPDMFYVNQYLGKIAQDLE